MKGIPEKETLAQIAELFKGFADPTRVHILCLSKRGCLLHPASCSLSQTGSLL